MQTYTCSTCEQIHQGLRLSYGSEAPALWFDIPASERAERSLLSSDQCIIDDKYFFVLGRVEIPILDTGDIFSWNVWVSLSEKSFDRMTELWETEGRETEPPCFGWLSTVLPCYSKTTLNLKANVHTRPKGERPFVELEPTNHPLAQEQCTGITMKRVQEIAELILHS